MLVWFERRFTAVTMALLSSKRVCSGFFICLSQLRGWRTVLGGFRGRRLPI